MADIFNYRKDRKERMPPVVVSSDGKFIHGFNFIVTLNNITYGFQSVSGLRITKNKSYYHEGGVNDHQIMCYEPISDTPELVFKRGLLIRKNPILSMAARSLAARIPNNLARQAALQTISALDPQVALELGPALGMIEVYDRGKRLSAKYSFLSLGMTDWDGGDLDAENSGILIESVTIAHTGLLRIPLEEGKSTTAMLSSVMQQNEREEQQGEA